MSENQTDAENHFPSEEFRTVPKDSESFRTIPKGSEHFGRLPNDSAIFGTIPQFSERKENHILTVRETAQRFEFAGVARTERSILNWCQPNRQGIARLDSYFDPNERKYFITPESVDAAIQEEVTRTKGKTERPESLSANPTEMGEKSRGESPDKTSEQFAKLNQEMLDLRILNGGKDFLIQQLRDERGSIIQQLVASSQKIGALETKLLQLEQPR